MSLKEIKEGIDNWHQYWMEKKYGPLPTDEKGMDDELKLSELWYWVLLGLFSLLILVFIYDNELTIDKIVFYILYLNIGIGLRAARWLNRDARKHNVPYINFWIQAITILWFVVLPIYLIYRKKFISSK